MTSVISPAILSTYPDRAYTERLFKSRFSLIQKLYLSYETALRIEVREAIESIPLLISYQPSGFFVFNAD